jgi:hypothetical protein
MTDKTSAWDRWVKKVSITVGAIISCIILIGYVVSYSSSFAKAKDVRLLEQRLEQKITQDKYDWTYRKIGELEYTYRNNQMPKDVYNYYRGMKNDLKKYDKELR